MAKHEKDSNKSFEALQELIETDDGVKQELKRATTREQAIDMSVRFGQAHGFKISVPEFTEKLDAQFAAHLVGGKGPLPKPRVPGMPRGGRVFPAGPKLGGPAAACSAGSCSLWSFY